MTNERISTDTASPADDRLGRPHQGGATILLVEDEAIIGLAEALVLQKNGYSVVRATSGEEAVALAADSREIDLVLMDIDLGSGMDGTEAARIILSDKDIPVVFLSSHTEPSIVERTEAITSYGYVVKNSGNTVLLASIKMAFRLHEARMDLVARQRRLAESEARFRAIYDQAFHLAGILGTDGTLLDANRMARDFIGGGDRSAIGKPFWEAPWWTHSPALVERLKRAIIRAAQGETARFEADHIDSAGATHHIDFSLKPVRDDGGEVFCLIAEGRDVSELKRTEYEYRRILDAMQAVYYRADLSGRVVAVSASIKEMLGYEPSEVVGREIAAEFYQDPGQRQAMLMAMEEGAGRVHDFPVVLKRRDGSPVPARASSHYILGPSGEREGLEGIVTGIGREAAR